MNANTRTIFNIILTLILLGLVISTRGQEVSIPDPGLNAAVRDALQIPRAPLTEQDLLNLIVLDASGRDVKSITGLEFARNLAVLDLQVNSLTNFSLPNALTNLSTLDLTGNLLTNCTLPAGMTNLAKIVLETNALKTVTLPPGLTGLNDLILDHNQLTNLTLPPDMTNLVVLSVVANPLTTLVLSERLAASKDLSVNLTTLDSLRSQGVSVFTYPLDIQLTKIQQPPGAFRFGITGPPGIYTVLSSTNLATWSVLDFATNPLGSVFFNDPTAHLSARKFYRAELNP